MKREVNMRSAPDHMSVGADKAKKNNSNAARMQTDERINTDPFGSYTGVPTEGKNEKPIQDADDL